MYSRLCSSADRQDFVDMMAERKERLKIIKLWLSLPGCHAATTLSSSTASSRARTWPTSRASGSGVAFKARSMAWTQASSPARILAR